MISVRIEILRSFCFDIDSITSEWLLINDLGNHIEMGNSSNATIIGAESEFLFQFQPFTEYILLSGPQFLLIMIFLMTKLINAKYVAKKHEDSQSP